MLGSSNESCWIGPDLTTMPLVRAGWCSRMSCCTKQRAYAKDGASSSQAFPLLPRSSACSRIVS